MRRVLITTLLLMCSIVLAEKAGACLSAPPRHRVNEFAVQTDSIAPAKPHLVVREIRRGKIPDYIGDGIMQISSLDDLGMVYIDVTGLTDDQTPPKDIGLRIINLNESSKYGKQMEPPYDISGYNSISLSWSDGTHYDLEPLCERFAVYAIDAAGNLSVEPDTLEIIDPGRTKPIPKLSVEISSNTISIEHGQLFDFNVRVTNISSEPVMITKDIRSSLILTIIDPNGNPLSPGCLSDIPDCAASPTENFIWIDPGKFREETITLEGLPATDKHHQFRVTYWWRSCPDWPVGRNERVRSGKIPFFVKGKPGSPVAKRAPSLR